MREAGSYSGALRLENRMGDPYPSEIGIAIAQNKCRSTSTTSHGITRSVLSLFFSLFPTHGGDVM